MQMTIPDLYAQARWEINRLKEILITRETPVTTPWFLRGSMKPEFPGEWKVRMGNIKHYRSKIAEMR